MLGMDARSSSVAELVTGAAVAINASHIHWEGATSVQVAVSSHFAYDE